MRAYVSVVMLLNVFRCDNFDFLLWLIKKGALKMSVCECVPLIEEYFPRPIAEIVRLYAGSITQDAISDWLLDNKLRVGKATLYCQYYASNKLWILIDSTGCFEVEAGPTFASPDNVAGFLQSVDGSWVDRMLEASSRTSLNGSFPVADLVLYKLGSERAIAIRKRLNRLGRRMQKQLVPRCAHDA